MKPFKIYKKGTAVIFMAVLFFILTSLISYNDYSSKKKVFSFVSQDSVTIEVNAFFNKDSTLSGYKAYIFSPVCDDTTCYPVEIEFYWDVLGNFQKYEILPGKELTKLDHEPFSEKDYQKFTRLLNNNNPWFWGMSKQELIGDVVNDSIDGYSGATVQAVKEEVIEGAVYSCYTLWHIAHGEVADSIKKYTQTFLSPGLVTQWINSENSDAYFYLINHFSESDFAKYTPEVLFMMRRSKGYLAQRALERMPEIVLKNGNFQDSLATIYPTLDYYAQRTILKRIDGLSITETLAKAMLENIEPRSSFNLEMIIRIFCDGKNTFSLELNEYFLKKLLKNEVQLNKEQYKQLEDLGKENKKLKNLTKKLKQNITN